MASSETHGTHLLQRAEPVKIRPIRQLALPEGCRMIVNMTVDFDTMLFRKYMNEPYLWQTQGEFGGRVGMSRLLDLFGRYGVKATVFLPGYVGEMYPDIVQRIVEEGHELANHMWLHYIPEDPLEEKEHLDKTDELVKRFSGSYPVGTRSEHDLSLLEGRSYRYYSYLPADSLPFYVFNETLNDWILNIPFNFLYDDAMFFYFGWFGSKNEQQRIESPDIYVDVLKESFRQLYDTARYMNVCFHPNISGRGHRVRMLETFLQEIRRHEGVVCETSSWLADHIARTENVRNG